MLHFPLNCSTSNKFTLVQVVEEIEGETDIQTYIRRDSYLFS